MILWTIQHKDAYEKMLQTGILQADVDYVDESFRVSYEWMANQMSNRIGRPPRGVSMPVWAWYQWERKRKRPDMRSHGRWSDKGMPIVLLTIDVPDECVLLSDFECWHAVLNDVDLVSLNDDNVYSKKERQKSWEKIFDYENAFGYEEWNIGVSIQACMWQVKAEWVLKVEHFVSR